MPVDVVAQLPPFGNPPVHQPLETRSVATFEQMRQLMDENVPDETILHQTKLKIETDPPRRRRAGPPARRHLPKRDVGGRAPNDGDPRPQQSGKTGLQRPTGSPTQLRRPPMTPGLLRSAEDLPDMPSPEVDPGGAGVHETFDGLIGHAKGRGHTNLTGRGIDPQIHATNRLASDLHAQSVHDEDFTGNGSGGMMDPMSRHTPILPPPASGGLLTTRRKRVDRTITGGILSFCALYGARAGP